MRRWRDWATKGRRWAFGLAAALLLAQALGLAHHVLHGGTPAHDDEHFAGHEAGDAQCRLIDALAGGDALPAAVTAVADPPGAVAQPVFAGAARVAACAGAPYEARAPPRG